MKTKKILISGGLGFIGHHLCKQLLATTSNCEITLVDDLSSSTIDYSELAGLVTLIIGDFRSLPQKHGPFDEIYHLASPVGSLGILAKHGRIAFEILELANAAAGLARQSGARLLYVSSSEVYGREGLHEESVEQIVTCRRGSRMEYALGKLTAEHVLLNLASKDQFEVRIVRPFNAMGAGQRAQLGFVIPRFFESALSGLDLQVHYHGTQVRSFCHVDDLAAGIIAVQQKGKSGEIYNVGHPDNRISIAALAEKIRCMCRSGSAIKNIDPRVLYGNNFIEAFDKIPEIGKVTEHTGWRPFIGLDMGLQRIFSHYRGYARASEENLRPPAVVCEPG